MRELRPSLLQAQNLLLGVLFLYSIEKTSASFSVQDLHKSDNDLQIAHMLNAKNKDINSAEDVHPGNEKEAENQDNFQSSKTNINIRSSRFSPNDSSLSKCYFYQKDIFSPCFQRYMQRFFTPYNEQKDTSAWENGHYWHAFPKENYQHPKTLKSSKKLPVEVRAKSFREGFFPNNLGNFFPVQRRKRDAENARDDSSERLPSDGMMSNKGSNHLLNYLEDSWNLNKRHLGMGSSGLHGDIFNDGWGTFSTMKKRIPEWDSSGFHGDVFSDGFGSFYTMKKRMPKPDAYGFHENTFDDRFGDSYPMKRIPEMSSSGFHGDTFSGGFGDFYTMKKKPSVQSRGTKRLPEMTSSGFYGDTFSSGFGDFSTMKRRNDGNIRSELTTSSIFEPELNDEFMDFYALKNKLSGISQESNHENNKRWALNGMYRKGQKRDMPFKLELVTKINSEEHKGIQNGQLAR